MSGTELRESIQRKYGRTYDLSIVRRQLAGRPIVAMNVMWTHLEQQSFPMSETEYMDKLNNIAFYLGAWGQTEVVRAFFDAPAKSRNGLPGRRPVVGNAISLRLELPAAVIEEWFGR
ncbi:hypothetical protein WJX81_004053 [Elliptochloris bilobata]|uniref:DUF2384 domain-containing protein n=1 Tax=Elliptochloris bilobata TaxID=381761 RepID=A0AAW1RE13_9CHLO